MSIKKFVGRENAIEQIQSVLTNVTRAGDRLTIQSIYGAGGIGKSWLFKHAESGVDLKNQNYISMRIDGNSLSSDTVEKAVTSLIDSAKTNAPLDNTPRYYFPAVQRVIKQIEVIRRELAAEAAESKQGDNSDFQKLLSFAFSTGESIQDIFPGTRNKININEFKKLFDSLEEIIPTMKSLQIESPFFFERLGVGGSRSLRNSIKENACAELARAFMSDISAILSGYQRKDKLKATQSKLEGVDKLLLIIDDFEKLQNSIGTFLTSHLLPGLSSADFKSVVFILGRDQLEATDPSWDQHLGKFLMPQIALTPLSQSETYNLIELHIGDRLEEKERAWRDTQGYPFYLQLWIEEQTSGGRSAIMLQRFHDRTTRWMTKQQKEWLQQIIFMSEINIRTLKRFFSNEEAEEVFQWFKNEGSIRDTTGTTFCVREYLRSRLLDYLRITNPDRFDQLERQAYLALKTCIADQPKPVAD